MTRVCWLNVVAMEVKVFSQLFMSSTPHGGFSPYPRQVVQGQLCCPSILSFRWLVNRSILFSAVICRWLFLSCFASVGDCLAFLYSFVSCPSYIVEIGKNAQPCLHLLRAPEPRFCPPFSHKT